MSGEWCMGAYAKIKFKNSYLTKIRTLLVFVIAAVVVVSLVLR